MQNYKGLLKIFRHSMRTGLLPLLLVMTSAGMALAHPGNGQEILDRKVNIAAEEREIKEILKELGRQTNVKFVYSAQKIPAKQKTSLNANNVKLAVALDRLLSPFAVKYKVSGGQIILLPETDESLSTSSPETMEKNIQLKISGISPDARVIKGKVTDEKGEGLSGVSITVKGTNKGTTTLADGTFSIEAETGETLEFSIVGYKTLSLKLAGETSLAIRLEQEISGLEEVVVTALGITKEKRKVGFATQEVKGSAMEKAREPNILSNLTGKVAGLNIFNTSTLYENPAVSLRGRTPLVVIDGVPTRTDFWNLNPDDIESITVLKSNAAALLYGGPGVNGAIQITTKKGKGGANGVEVSVNTSTQFQAGFLKIPEVQTEYGMGWGGYYAFIDGRGGGGWYDNYGYVWGPKLNQKDPNSPSGWLEVPQYNSPYDPNQWFEFKQNGYTDYSHYKPIPWITRSESNLKKFLRNEMLTSTNVSIAGKTDKSDYRISLTHLYQKGQIPNTQLNSTTLNLAGSLKLSEKLRAEATVSYNKQYTPNYPHSGYGPTNFLYNIILWMGPDVDINDLRNYWKPGRTDLEQFTYNYTWYNNPWFLANEYLRAYTNDVIVSQANITYDINKDLTFFIRSGATVSNAFSDTKTPYSFINYGASRAPYGQYDQSRNNSLRLVSEAMLTYKKKFLSDFDVTVSVGGSDRYEQFSSLSSNTVGGLQVPKSYNLGNSREPSQTFNNLSEREVRSVYGYADLDYKKMIYLNLSGRNDWSSALQKPNNSFFYPSASLGLIVSEMISMPSFISYAKIRSAYANVSSDPDAYFTLPVYSRGIRWNGLPSLVLPGSIYDTDIEPNRTISREAGIELKFLKNRIGLDVTYFNYLDKNSIRNVPLSQASGYTNLIVNGDTYNRKGIEVIATTTPVKTSRLQWDVLVNYSRLRETVKEYYGGDSIRGSVKVGERRDVYYGWDWERSPDGKIVYNSNGLPKYINQRVNMGYTGSDWEFGITNNFRYRNFILSFSFDGRIGGKMFNGVESKLYEGGSHKATANKFRDEAYEGLKTYIGNGVVVLSGSVQYDVQGNIISDTRKFAPNTTEVNYIDWVFEYFVNGIDGSNLYDRTFVKLREATITYELSSKLLKKTPFKSVNISAVGRNLLLFTKVPYMDPEAYQGFALAEPTYRNIGINLNVKF